MIMVIVGKQISRKLILKVLGTLAAVLVVSGILIWFGLVWREKQQFSQAEQEIDALYAQIVEKVGKPDQEKKEKSCGYSSRVYGKGPRSCSVSQQINFSVSSVSEANNRMLSVLRLSGGTYLQQFGDKNRNRFLELGLYRTKQIIDQDYKDLGDLVCNLSYEFPIVESATGLRNSDPKSLSVLIHCGGSAMIEHYPVKD